MRRFEYESQILARLRHPGIAQVYEAGTHRDESGTVPFTKLPFRARCFARGGAYNHTTRGRNVPPLSRQVSLL